MGWLSRKKPAPVAAPLPDAAEVLTAGMFARLAALGLAPRHIVDIGGNHGNWTRGALAAFPQARVTMFEPQSPLAPKHADLAADPRVRIEYAGVGDFDGSLPFTFHSRDDSSSFIYSSQAAAQMGLTQSQVPICRLDTAMAASALGAPELVKIDAEGLDLKVLDGATQTLAQAQVVLVEATVACPEYPNTAARVFARMDDLGYRLFDITDLNRTPQLGVLWLIEAVFVRKDSALALASTTYR